MSCTRRGFLKTIGAAMVGLGLTRLEPLRAFASSSVSGPEGAAIGGPPSGLFSIDSLRALAVEAAHWTKDTALADELSDICCWAPAATSIRSRPLSVQARGAERFFRDFPGGDQLAQVLLYTNNTTWRRPRFRFDPEELVEQHYELLQRPRSGGRTEIVQPGQLNGRGGQARVDLMFDRETGERLAKAADRTEPMWAALSVLSGMMLDPTDDLSQRLTPWLSLGRKQDRSLARTAAVRYSQIVIGSAQRAVWSDQLGGENAALPLLKLSAAGYLPLGEEDGRFVLLRVGGTHLTGYRSGVA